MEHLNHHSEMWLAIAKDNGFSDVAILPDCLFCRCGVRFFAIEEYDSREFRVGVVIINEVSTVGHFCISGGMHGLVSTR